MPLRLTSPLPFATRPSQLKHTRFGQIGNDLDVRETPLSKGDDEFEKTTQRLIGSYMGYGGPGMPGGPNGPDPQVQAMLDNAKPIDQVPAQGIPALIAPIAKKVLARLNSTQDIRHVILEGEKNEVNHAILQTVAQYDTKEGGRNRRFITTIYPRTTSDLMGPNIVEFAEKYREQTGMETNQGLVVYIPFNQAYYDTPEAHLSEIIKHLHSDRSLDKLRDLNTQLVLTPGDGAPLTAKYEGIWSKFEILKTRHLPPLKWFDILKTELADINRLPILVQSKLQFTQEGLETLFQQMNAQDDKPTTQSVILTILDQLATTIASGEIDAEQTHNGELEITPLVVQRFFDQHQYHHALNDEELFAGRPKTAEERYLDLMEGQSKQQDDNKPFQYITPDDIDTTMDDVIGLEKAKAYIQDFMRLSRFPNVMAHIRGGRSGGYEAAMLLHGPPGNGKTELAKATAKTVNGTFISTTGSSFVRYFVGSGSDRVDQLVKAIKEAPTENVVIFIDEIDALGQREGNTSGGSGEYAKTLNSILIAMDGMTKLGKNIFWIGATNRPEGLDEALRSRFKKEIEVPIPTLEQRVNQFKVQVSRVPGLVLASPLTLKDLAEMTDGFSGRMIRNVIEFAMEAITRDTPDDVMDRLNGDPEALEKHQWLLTRQIAEESVQDAKTKAKEEEQKPFQGFVPIRDRK